MRDHNVLHKGDLASKLTDRCHPGALAYCLARKKENMLDGIKEKKRKASRDKNSATSRHHLTLRRKHGTIHIFEEGNNQTTPNPIVSSESNNLRTRPDFFSSVSPPFSTALKHV